MKRILLTALAVLMCLTALGCKESDTVTVEFENSNKRLFLDERKELGEELADIGLKALSESDGQNAICSPLIEYTLFTDKSKDELDTLSSYTARLGYSEDSFFAPSYTFYIKDDRELEGDLFSGYCLYPEATVYKTDSESSNISRINRFVKNATSSVVSSVFSTKDKTLSPDLTAISVMSFTGKWAKQYTSANVKDGIFTDKSGTEQKVKYLCSIESYYLECGGGYGVRKSYRGGDFAFIALLPPEGMSVESYVKGLSASEFTKAMLDPHFTAVNTRIPKFTATECSELASEKTLPTVAGERPEYYFEATCFSVSENGTTGASVTTSNVDSTLDEEDPRTVLLDRPFLYAVIDKDTGAPIIMGIVNHVE